MKEKYLNKADRRFLLSLVGFAIVCILYYYEGRMNVQNTTAYLFSYRYGFIPRGLVGSILDCLLTATNWHLTYRGAKIVSWAVTIGFFLALFSLYFVCLKKTPEEKKNIVKILIIVISIFAFPMILTWNNFGRLDEYLWLLTILAVILLVMEKIEWLIIPLCLIACLIHEGFAFTNSGIILAILLWKICTRTNRDRRKYILIFIASFVCISGVFLYMTFWRTPVDQMFYDIIEQDARQLAEVGGNIDNFNDAYSLLKSELLCEDVYEDETVWHRVNRIETPIFLLLFLPIIILGIQFLRRLIMNSNRKNNILKNIIIIGGVVTIVPELLLKVDFGRWFFCILMYYCIVMLALVVMGDSHVTDALQETGCAVVRRCPCWWAIFPYLLLFMPFRDVYISDISTQILNVITSVWPI